MLINPTTDQQWWFNGSAAHRDNVFTSATRLEQGSGKETSTHLLCRIPNFGTRVVFSWVAQCQVAQLIALMEDSIADGDVDNAR